jgi:transglutaminase-like putative cysteine protease
MTRLTVRAYIDWIAEQPATAVLLVRVAHVAGQVVGEEDLKVDNAEVEDPGPRPRGGARPLRLHARPGPVRLRYVASVEVDDAPLDTDVTLPTLGDLDLELLPWTLPSRYCPSDVLAATAEHLFAGTPRTGALLEQVRGWVEANIAYVPGTSDVHTAADETMLRRTGVCRDLAHLTAALLRGLGVPARLVSAYALDLEPQDFHAVVEAHDGRAWRLLDATGLAPVGTLARIVTGRDAAEIAWGTTEGPLTLDRLEVAVARA